MSGHPGTRPHTGAPPRTLALANLIAERGRLSALPPSPERTKALRRVSAGLRNIENRSQRRGA